MELLTFALPDSELQSTIVRGQAGEELTPLERRPYERYRNAWLRYWENMHYQRRSGLPDEVEFDGQREAIRSAFSLPGVVAYWCAPRSMYSPEFVDDVNGLLTAHRC